MVVMEKEVKNTKKEKTRQFKLFQNNTKQNNLIKTQQIFLGA